MTQRSLYGIFLDFKIVHCIFKTFKEIQQSKYVLFFIYFFVAHAEVLSAEPFFCLLRWSEVIFQT